MQSLLLLLSLICASLGGQVYPPWSFLRTFYPNSVYSEGYCVTTGTSSVEIGAANSNQMWEAVQPCQFAQVSLWGLGNGTQVIQFGLIGNIQAAVVNLGTLNQIRLDNHITSNVDSASPYTSIHWNETAQQFQLITDYVNGNLVFSQLQNKNVQSLMTVSSQSTPYINGAVGDVFLIRTTNGYVNNSWKGTQLFLKAILVEQNVLQWDVFYIGNTAKALPNIVIQ